MSKPIRIASVIGLLAAVLVIAQQWRGHFERSLTEPAVAPPHGADDAAPDPAVAAGGAEESELPTAMRSTVTVATETAPIASREAPPAEQDLDTVVAGVDPLLSGRNLIARPHNPERKGAGFEELELRFSTEVADADWSPQTETRILDQVSQVTGLALVTLEAECRESVCRVKLSHPPDTDALSSLAKLRRIAGQIGFGHVVEVATIGDDGIPISVLYFEREKI